MLSRRNALTVLGLASSGFAVEDTIKPEVLKTGSVNGYVTGRDVDNKRFAAALRKLADEIESGGIAVERLGVQTEALPDAIVRQEMSLHFTING